MKTILGFVWHNLMLMARHRWRHLGFACVNFGIPVSAKAYCLQQGIDFSRLERADRFARVEILAQLLLAEIEQIIPILPVSLLSTLFVRNPHSRFSIVEIHALVYQLIEELAVRDAKISFPRKSEEHTIANALKMLHIRHLIDQFDDLYQMAPDALEILSYYANSIAHWFPRVIHKKESGFVVSPEKPFNSIENSKRNFAQSKYNHSRFQSGIGNVRSSHGDFFRWHHWSGFGPLSFLGDFADCSDDYRSGVVHHSGVFVDEAYRAPFGFYDRNRHCRHCFAGSGICDSNREFCFVLRHHSFHRWQYGFCATIPFLLRRKAWILLRQAGLFHWSWWEASWEDIWGPKWQNAPKIYGNSNYMQALLSVCLCFIP